MTASSDIRADWLRVVLSTNPADRSRAEGALRDLYSAAGITPPEQYIWFDSPFLAAWAVAVLIEPRNQVWRDLLASSVQSREERQRLDTLRRELCDRTGSRDWTEAMAAVGPPLSGFLQFPPAAPPPLHAAILDARMGLSDDLSALFAAPSEEDDVFRAETNLWGGARGVLMSAPHGATIGQLVGQSFYSEYSCTMMADDECRIGTMEPPQVLRAAWTIARSAGLWWPFANAVVLSDRPSELYTDDRKLLHRVDGPAAVYRDGTRVYAWEGVAFSESWILHPQDIPARDVKHLAPSFRKHVASLGGSSTRQKPTRRRPKPSPILTADLPAAFEARIEHLRSHAGGTLTLFDLYIAGDHRGVWQQLVALGEDVRHDPHVADALAVALETMRRVSVNVDTVVQRLAAMGYAFSSQGSRTDDWTARAEQAVRVDLESLRGEAPQPQGSRLFDIAVRARDFLARGIRQVKQRPRDYSPRPHVPPGPQVLKDVIAFESVHGPLPLSLRAFYEMVGEVNLIGVHPTLSPRDGAIAPDPLVVYALDAGAIEDEDEDGALIIAPDDLHKADVSGGDPYEMAFPDPRADAELLNERHGLMFVDYLRLCFQFGGFPGYEGSDPVPAEIESLRAGLLDF